MLQELYEYHKQKEQVEPVGAREMYLDIFATGLQTEKYELRKYSDIISTEATQRRYEWQ